MRFDQALTVKPILPIASKRKLNTCRCDAYPFPHRMFGGNCDGVRPGCCSECRYADVMHDAYGTGDSPTLYECKKEFDPESCNWGDGG